MNILGLNAFHGDASAALLVDGHLAFALEEERLNRIKHWAGFPALAAQACLGGTDLATLEHVAISRDPRAHFGTKLARVLTRPGGWRRTTSRANDAVKVARLASRLCAAGIPSAVSARTSSSTTAPSRQRALRVAVRRSGSRLDHWVRRLQQRH